MANIPQCASKHCVSAQSENPLAPPDSSSSADSAVSDSPPPKETGFGEVAEADGFLDSRVGQILKVCSGEVAGGQIWKQKLEQMGAAIVENLAENLALIALKHKFGANCLSDFNGIQKKKSGN